MLSFEKKKLIFQSFSELKEKPISNDRVNYFYPDSLQSGRKIATELSQSGNGYVLGKYMSDETIKNKGYKIDLRGWISIKDYSEQDLVDVIKEAMWSMSGKEIVLYNPKALGNQPAKQEDIEKVNKLVSEDLVRSCLYNWLGYGNINAPIWFLGIEEGGAEVWRNATKTLVQSLDLRSEFDLDMDFRTVWENKYEIALESFRGANVWLYMVAFLLELEGKSSNPTDIHSYIFSEKKLGRTNSNHFLGELMPLPKKYRTDMESYKHIWKTLKDYYEDVLAERFSLIRNTIIENADIRLLVSYDRKLTDLFLDYFGKDADKTESWEFGKQRYRLYCVSLQGERRIYLLSTPFFGNGQISYSSIKDAVKRIKYILQ